MIITLSTERHTGKKGRNPNYRSRSGYAEEHLRTNSKSVGQYCEPMKKSGALKISMQPSGPDGGYGLKSSMF